MWVSGFPAVCLCCDQATALQVVREHFDVIDQVYVGEVVCPACAGHYLYTRHPTKDERATLKGQARFSFEDEM